MRYLILLFLFFGLSALPAQERFTGWHTEVEPRKDRSVDITETITVTAAGDAVKRGITRSLPLDGGADVTVLSVERDGREEAYHTDRSGGKLTVYAGRREVLLAPGTYEYRIRYRLENQVRRIGELDELELNLLGPRVTLPVDSLTATVRLPSALTAKQYACYTGRTGSTATNCTMTAPADGALSFAGVGTYGQGQVMTIAVGFAPGWFAAADAQPVAAPPAELNWWQREGSVFILVLGLFGFLYYAYTSWRTHGVDPPMPQVGPVFAPPLQHSPAAIGYLSAGLVSDATAYFTASIMALAGKGLLTIEPEEDKGVFSTTVTYHLRRRSSPAELAPLPPEQEALFRALFAEADDVSLDATYDKRFQQVAQAHEASLTEQFGEFRSQGNNGKKVLPLIAIFLVSFIAAAFFVKTDTTGFGLPLFVIFGLACPIVFVVYVFLIRRPSPEKVKLRAEIASFREYLNMSEKKRSRLLNAPKMSPEHYEAMLPYAIALGISTKWTEYFGELMQSSTYRPVYVIGPGAFNPATFGKDFSTAVAGTSTQPQSASGGGGAAGVGGGGGGAGGW